MISIYTPSLIDSDTEEQLWKSAIMVFDTSALLDFYYMTEDNQKLIADILSFLSDRILLPAQVEYEFLKNRECVMRKPITEKYNDKDLQKNRLIDQLKSYIIQWEKQYYHPNIDEQKLDKIKRLLNEIAPKVAEIKTIVAKEYEKRKKEIGAINENDVLGNVVSKLPKGTPFSFSAIKNIVAEGTYRYSNKIPPGYEDAQKKSGICQYGDLIIWKEMMGYAKTNAKDLIYICNDVKPDWIIAKETNKDKTADKAYQLELGNPRRELLAEFEEETGRRIWFYKTSDFIERIEKIYKPTQPVLELQGKLGVVRDILQQIGFDSELRRKSHWRIFTCTL